MNTAYLIGVLLVTAGVTILLRSLPFLLFSRAKQPPEFIHYLGKVLSPAAIAILIVYCYGSYFHDRPFATHGFGIAEIGSGLLVILLQKWKHNPLLSIIAGTALYMVLVQTVFP